MFSGLMTAIATSAALGWTARRVGEIGALIAFIAPAFLSLPPAYQDALLKVLSGQGGELSVATYFGLAGYVLTQWRSYRSTVRPQVVTSEGTKRHLPELTEEQARAITGYQGPIVDRSRR